MDETRRWILIKSPHSSGFQLSLRAPFFLSFFFIYRQYCEWFDSLKKNIIVPSGRVGTIFLICLCHYRRCLLRSVFALWSHHCHLDIIHTVLLMKINSWTRWYCLVRSQSRHEGTHAHKYVQPKRLWTNHNCSSAHWCASMSRPWDRTWRNMTVSTRSRINYQQQ